MNENTDGKKIIVTSKETKNRSGNKVVEEDQNINQGRQIVGISESALDAKV